MLIRSYNTRHTLLQTLLVALTALSLLLPQTATGADDNGPALLEKLQDHKVTLKTQDLKVETLLHAIARQAGINIFVADNIDETISVDMEEIVLRELFLLIMEAKQLHYTEKGKVVFVEKKSDFKKGLKDVITARFCTKFGNVAEHLDQLQLAMSPEGSITKANRGKCVIIRDHANNVVRAEKMLAELDQPVPQIHIEARIVTISQEAKKRLGIKWGYDNRLTTDPVNAGVDLSVAGSSTVSIGFIRDNLNLAVDIQALHQEDMLEILSAPQILVMDGKEAEIKQGKEVPYVTQSGDLLNTSFREANLSLKVTPTVMQDDFVLLDLLVTNDSVDQSSVAGAEPLISKQEISTNLLLENNSTVVIGGILLESDDNQHGSVPGLSRLPIVGNLFKNKETSRERSELLVFITPKVVNMHALSILGNNDTRTEGKADASEPESLDEIITEPVSE